MYMNERMGRLRWNELEWLNGLYIDGDECSYIWVIRHFDDQFASYRGTAIIMMKFRSVYGPID